MKANWKHWDMGWGENAKLAPGLELSASKSMERNKNFQASVFGNRLKNNFESIEEAKRAAEVVAFRFLEQALKNLEDQ